MDLTIAAEPGFGWKIFIRGTDVTYDFKGDVNTVRAFAEAVERGDSTFLAQELGTYVDIGTADAGNVVATLFNTDMLWFQDSVIAKAADYQANTLLDCLAECGEELVATLG